MILSQIVIEPAEIVLTLLIVVVSAKIIASVPLKLVVVVATVGKPKLAADTAASIL